MKFLYCQDDQRKFFILFSFVKFPIQDIEIPILKFDR